MDGGGAGIRRCSADAASTDERLRAEAIGSTAEGDASTAEPEVKSVAAVVTRHISFWQRCLPLLCLGLMGESYKHEPQHSHTLAQHHGCKAHLSTLTSGANNGGFTGKSIRSDNICMNIALR